jgi:hypothetical protein
METKFEHHVTAVESWRTRRSNRGERQVGKREDLWARSKYMGRRLERLSAAHWTAGLKEKEVVRDVVNTGGIDMVVERL